MINFRTLELLKLVPKPVGVCYLKSGALPIGIATATEMWPIPRELYLDRSLPPRLLKPVKVKNNPRLGACQTDTYPTLMIDVLPW